MPIHSALTGADLHAPGAHKTQHEDGGTDEISLTGLTGAPLLTTATTAVTQSPGDNTTKVATTAFVTAAVSAGSVSDGDKGDVVVSSSGTVWTIDSGVVSGSKIASSVALAGSPTTTTQAASDNSTKIATTAYVDAAVGGAAAGGNVSDDKYAGWAEPGSPNAMNDEFDGSSSATWIDINTPTYTLEDDRLIVTATATDAKKLRVQTAPATPWTAVAAVTTFSTSTATTDGMWLRESGTGELYVYTYGIDGALNVHSYSGPGAGTFVGTAVSAINSRCLSRHIWLAITDDGTDLLFWHSPDGTRWIRAGSNVDRDGFMAGGPDQVGVGTNGVSEASAAAFHHFRVYASATPP